MVDRLGLKELVEDSGETGLFIAVSWSLAWVHCNLTGDFGVVDRFITSVLVAYDIE